MRAIGVAATGTLIAFCTAGANAGGFAILPQSASSLGNAVASAAAAEDAATIWFNPAGMTLLPGKFNFAASTTVVFPSIEYREEGSTGIFSNPGSGDGGDAGSNALVPSLFISARVSERITVGLGINSPFGLKTQYEPNWRGAPIAVKSEAQSINLNPALAVQLNDQISVGVGLSVQRLSVELTNVSVAGDLRVKVHDYGTGFNAGVLYRSKDDARIGLAYRSAIDYALTGDASFAQAPFLNGNVAADLKVPDTLSIHGFSPLGKRWEGMFDVTFTKWSHIDTINVLKTSGIDAGTILAPLVNRWRNTRTVGLGANYKPYGDNRTKIRFGIGYDQTPTTDATRSVDLPEQNSLAVTVGLHQRNPFGAPGVFDIALMVQRFKDAAINQSTSPPTPGSALVGHVKQKGPILAVQYSNSF